MFPLLNCCVAAAVSRLGKFLASFVPGADALIEVVEYGADVWERWKKQKPAEADRREELQALAHASAERVEAAVQAAIQAEAAGQPAAVKRKLTNYLIQVQVTVRRTLGRQADPEGRTEPTDLRLNSAEDLRPFLPPQLPRFEPGELKSRRRRGVPGWGWLAGIAAAVVVAVVVALVVHNRLRPEMPDGPPVAAKGPGGDDKPKDANNKDIDPNQKKDKKDTPEKPAPLPNQFKNALGMEFVRIPKGRSWLGGGAGKPGNKDVEFKRDFYLGRFEVTQAEWEAVMGSNPSHFSRTGGGKDAVRGTPDEELKRFPVENVSYEDAKAFVAELNKRCKEEGWVYRLPTEAEWEYAARGGPMNDRQESKFDWYFEFPTNELKTEQANFDLGRPTKVGSYRPNRLGLHDMHGNIWEWCDDALADLPGLQHIDKDAAPGIVERGGCWHDGPEYRPLSARISFPPSRRWNDHGFRVARVPVGAEKSAPVKPEGIRPTTWKSLAGMPTARILLAAVTGPDGRIYAIGGEDANGRLDTVEVYDPSTNKWTTVASMPTARNHLAATIGPDNLIYAIGGVGGADSVEAYNPTTNKWTTVAPMPTARHGLAAVTGPDGRIYAIGGNGPGGSLNTVEAYDPTTNSWATVANMPTARVYLTAAMGPDGRIYAIGGFVEKDGKRLTTVEAYDTKTNSWTTVASMPTARNALAAATGPDGRIYAIGGHSVGGVGNIVEAYNPSANKWTTVAGMPTVRGQLAATTGRDGRVYAIGGGGTVPFLNTVEALVFSPSK